MSAGNGFTPDPEPPDRGRWDDRHRADRRLESIPFTPTPNDFYRKLLGYLAPEEYCVFSYFVHRTYGYKDRRAVGGECVSVQELQHGRLTREVTPRRIDRGCGVPRSTMLKALRVLVLAGLVFRERRKDARGGDDLSYYELNVDWDPDDDDALYQAARAKVWGPRGVSHHETGGGVSPRDRGVSHHETPSGTGGVSHHETPGVSPRDSCTKKIPNPKETEFKETTTTKNEPAFAGRKGGAASSPGVPPPPDAACGAVGVVSHKHACLERDGDGTGSKERRAQSKEPDPSRSELSPVSKVLTQPGRLTPPRPLTPEEQGLLDAIQGLPDHDDPAQAVSFATAEAIIRSHSEHLGVIRAMCKEAAKKQNPIGWLLVALPKAIEARGERAREAGRPAGGMRKLADVRDEILRGTYKTESRDPRDTPELLIQVLRDWEAAPGIARHDADLAMIRFRCQRAFQRNGIEAPP